MKSTVIRPHTIIVGGHRTSICLEDAFWNSLKEIAPKARRYHRRLERLTRRANTATCRPLSACSYSTGSAQKNRATAGERQPLISAASFGVRGTDADDSPPLKRIALEDVPGTLGVFFGKDCGGNPDL